MQTVHPGQPPRLLTPEFRAKVLKKIQEPLPEGSTHRSIRKISSCWRTCTWVDWPQNSLPVGLRCRAPGYNTDDRPAGPC